MYMPYLRGRQYELIALRELRHESRIGKHIIPIVEPVKLSPTLISTVESFAAVEGPISLIHNPQVGGFVKELRQLDDSRLKSSYYELLASKFVPESHIVNKNSETEIAQLIESGNTNRDELILILHNRNSLDSYPRSFLEQPPRFNLMPDHSTFRRTIRKSKVLLEDSFEKQERNVDYAEVDDEFFSNAHLFFRDDGFVGFSDYSIVGNQYTESGFAPFAVAIHIVYFDSANNLRIRHFVSDSNEDINDPAGKFYEAVSKLVEWNRTYKLQTLAMDIFEDHFKNGTYPGLGTVKKLSIMHHIELMSRYLDEVQDA